jgi:hypothetical protein
MLRTPRMNEHFSIISGVTLFVPSINSGLALSAVEGLRKSFQKSASILLTTPRSQPFLEALLHGPLRKAYAWLCLYFNYGVQVQ